MATGGIFTIGHSIHPAPVFLDLLSRSGIQAVVDVRSVPYSQFADQYNREALQAFLEKGGVRYLPMGNLLGARHENPSLLFKDGRVDFRKVMKSAGFLEGVARLEEGVRKGFRIALMCSEKNPLECHRFSLISHFLDERGHEVLHILPEQTIPHQVLYGKLFDYFKAKNKVSLDLEKVLGLRGVQRDLFGEPSREDLFLSLNRLVAYNPKAPEEQAP